MESNISPSHRGQKRRASWELASWERRPQATRLINIRCGRCTRPSPVLRLLHEIEERHAGVLLLCLPRLRVAGSSRLPQVYAEAGIVPDAFVEGFPVPDQDLNPEDGVISPLIICTGCVTEGGADVQNAAQHAADRVEELIWEAADDRMATLELERELHSFQDGEGTHGSGNEEYAFDH
jgi:hypothetical protein